MTAQTFGLILLSATFLVVVAALCAALLFANVRLGRLRWAALGVVAGQHPRRADGEVADLAPHPGDLAHGQLADVADRGDRPRAGPQSREPVDLAGDVEVIEETGANITVMVEILRQRKVAVTPEEATLFAIALTWLYNRSLQTPGTAEP